MQPFFSSSWKYCAASEVRLLKEGECCLPFWVRSLCLRWNYNSYLWLIFATVHSHVSKIWTMRDWIPRSSSWIWFFLLDSFSSFKSVFPIVLRFETYTFKLYNFKLYKELGLQCWCSYWSLICRSAGPVICSHLNANSG